MAEPTERDRDIFLEALEKLCATHPPMAPNGKQMVALGKVIVPALAAAREDARREAIEECAKIADDCIYMVGRIQAAAIAAKMRNLK